MEFFCSFSHGIECIKISLCSECETVSDIVYFVISEYGYHLCDTAIEFSFLISIIPPLCDSFLCHLHIIAVLTIGDMRNGSAMDKIIIENRNVGVKLIFCNFNYIVFIIVICVILIHHRYLSLLCCFLFIIISNNCEKQINMK